MGHYTTFSLILLHLVLQPLIIVSITRPVRHLHPPPDWELGLRESVHQALLREHYTDPGLRDHLLSAPFIGRQDTASPFGDIAVLARGQLYTTPQGFKFVQDSDCDCQSCLTSPQCQWKTFGHHKLLALWTVKRIRHRDPQYGHVFEIEYTISPVTHEIENLVKRHGYFNYNVPGHIFVIKIDPGVNLNGNVKEEKWYKKEFRDFKPGILIGVTPDGYKHILHSFPGFFTSYRPEIDQTTTDPKEYELYKKLIESLAAKTSNVPHRFSVTTPTTTTSYVQLTDGQFISTNNLITTQKLPTPKPITMPITTIHYYTPVETTKPTTDFDIFAEPVRTTTKIPTIRQQEQIPVVTSTEPMKPVTEVPQRTRPDTISEQLPAPDRNVETTVPYVTTTPRTTEKFKSTTFYTTIPKSETTIIQAIPITTSYGTTYVEPVHTTEIEKIPVTTLYTSQTPKSTNEIERIPVTTLYTSSSASTSTTEIEKVPVRTLGTTTRPKSTTILESVPVTTLHTSTSPKSSTYGTTIIEAVPVRTLETTTRPKDTTIIEALHTSTRPKSTTIIGSLDTSISPKTTTYGTTIIEAVPVRTLQTTTRPKDTTIIEAVPVTTLHTSTSPKSTTYGTTIIEAVPVTTLHASTDTTRYPTTGYVTTRYPTIGRGETIPVTTSTIPKTTSYGTTTTYSNPTTIFEYSFDSTTKNAVPIPTTSTSYTEEPTQYLKETTIPTKTIPHVVITTPSDDFLIDSYQKPSKIPEKKDFNEDDIFGPVQQKPSVEPIETTTKQLVQSDISQALFGGRRPKRVKISSKIRKPATRPPKIIYNNFYAPSTSSPTNTLLGTTVDSNGFETTTEIRPLTDQSISTSISFEVNKRNSSNLVEKLSETTTQMSKSETKKAFDDLALQLVNHARSIDYLNNKPSRQPKYRRRSFTTRKRSQRKNTKNPS